MDTVMKVAKSAACILRSRIFSATLLAIVSTVIVAAVSLNMNAVTVMDGDTSSVVLTMNDDAQVYL
jgi:Kef-type K+ transport system membrane component KefB